jgi:hypothetical protein
VRGLINSVNIVHLSNIVHTSDNGTQLSSSQIFIGTERSIGITVRDAKIIQRGNDAEVKRDKDGGLKVYEVKKIAGIEGHEEVGKIKVDEIVAEGLSRCTLVAGAEDVLGAFQEGHDLCVEERVKKDHSAAKAGQKAANVGRNVVEVGREAVDVGKKALEIGEGVSRIINAFKK